MRKTKINDEICVAEYKSNICTHLFTGMFSSFLAPKFSNNGSFWESLQRSGKQCQCTC